MKTLTKVAAMIAVFTCLSTGAFAQVGGLQATATSIRATAVLTTSNVIGTTFALPLNAYGVWYYATATKGSADSIVVTPCGAIDGNPLAASYYGVESYKLTLDTTRTAAIYVPREQFGAYKYAGCFARCIGTVTSSDCLISYKIAYAPLHAP